MKLYKPLYKLYKLYKLYWTRKFHGENFQGEKQIPCSVGKSGWFCLWNEWYTEWWFVLLFCDCNNNDTKRNKICQDLWDLSIDEKIVCSYWMQKKRLVNIIQTIDLRSPRTASGQSDLRKTRTKKCYFTFYISKTSHTQNREKTHV